MNIKQLIKNLGGRENVESISHCMTRIRVKVYDQEHVKRTNIAKEKEVIKEQFVKNEYQIVIGTGVEKYFNKLQYELNEQKETNIDWTSIASQIVVPAMPLLIISALTQGLVVLLYLLGLIKGNVYIPLINLIKMPILGLPIIFGYTSAKAFTVNPMIGSGLGIEILCLNYFHLTKINYSGTILPVIVGCIVFKYCFYFLNSKIRGLFGKTYNLTIAFWITSLLMIFLLAPISFFISKLLAQIFLIIMKNVPWLLAILASAIYVPLVVKGQHWWLTLIGLNNLGLLGFDWIFAFTSTAQFGQLGAVLGIGLRNNTIKTDKVYYSIKNSLFCIIEPALYNYSTLNKLRFIASLSGPIVSAVFLSYYKAKMYAFPMSILSFINPQQPNWKWLLVGVFSVIISILVSLVLAYILENKRFTTHKISLTLPLNGEKRDISESNDSIFASKVMGDGLIINPIVTDKEAIRAPIKGKVVVIASDNHAFGIESSAGVQIFVHIGINTLKMNKSAIKLKVHPNSLVNKGEEIGYVNVKRIKQAGFDPQTMLVLLKPTDYIFDKQEMILRKE